MSVLGLGAIQLIPLGFFPFLFSTIIAFSYDEMRLLFLLPEPEHLDRLILYLIIDDCLKKKEVCTFTLAENDKKKKRGGGNIL